MAKAIATKRRKPGRPATGKDPMIGLRAPPELRQAIEAWASRQEDTPVLSEAIRRLVELGLSHAAPKGRLSHEARAQASALAGKVVDQLTDSTAPEDEQQKRKRRLIHGPREFRDVRQDQHGAEAQPPTKTKRP
jgi:hypothetical protein